jgi:hypothetical protein
MGRHAKKRGKQKWGTHIGEGGNRWLPPLPILRPVDAARWLPLDRRLASGHWWGVVVGWATTAHNLSLCLLAPSPP